MRASGLPRNELFVSTKLAAEINDYDGAVAAIVGSLGSLALDYIDLMLIHSPQPSDDFRGGDYADGNRQAWRALEDAYRDGPYRDDGTPGTPTWIWSVVVVDGDVYVRAYNGTASRWHRSAMTQKAGQIRAGGIDAEVAFTPVNGEIKDRIDAAYAKKCSGNPYLPPMTSEKTSYGSGSEQPFMLHLAAATNPLVARMERPGRRRP